MRRGGTLFALSIVAAIAAPAPGSGHVPVKTLHHFSGDDGKYPDAPLIRDGQGNFYGTTSRGGTHDSGTIFKLSPPHKLTVLYSFTGGADGSFPGGRMVMDAGGNLYGMASNGGVEHAGTIYKYAPGGSFEILYAFNGRRHGEAPVGGLIMDAAGNLYGMTDIGGKFDWGTVFKIAPNKKLTVLHSFDVHSEGAEPSGPLLLDSGGNLYGTTAQIGLHGGGALFKLAPAGDGSYVWTLLHAFCAFQSGCNEGQAQYGVIADASGNLYGTTGGGGPYGGGIIYKLAPDGALTVLHSFGGLTEDRNPDGAGLQGPLVMDLEGNFYGVTSGRGKKGACCGTLFRLDADGTEQVLYYFRFLGAGGRTPRAGVFRDEAGFLYGTTANGGSDDHRSEYGIIFRYPH
jgi:uncharacterized repeat protein (TIGR03803 family)